ncbi:DNA mismatch repair protein [Emmonsiellopsis sp. PD_33]|nr:DNA mismatch repair protein [Emmonsiellopsis sp. PD_33]
MLGADYVRHLGAAMSHDVDAPALTSFDSNKLGLFVSQRLLSDPTRLILKRESVNFTYGVDKVNNNTNVVQYAYTAFSLWLLVMDTEVPSIKPLPSEVAAQLKSSISISHLNGVVLELLKNALDADARTVSVSVDFQKGGCVVEDDGYGILPVEFGEGGNLAKLHHTSKFNCQKEVYGRKGTFLASLVSLALVTLTAHHASASSTNTIIYHHSKPISRLVPAPVRHELDCRDHGTRVTVTDLFGNLPVRVKHRALSLRTNQDLDREWDELKSMITAILLASNKHVKVTASDATKSRKLVIKSAIPIPSLESGKAPGPLDLNRIRSILMQSGYISPRDSDSWATASARTSGISVESAISLQPSPTKQIQFISFGINPILSQTNANVLYNEINRLFSLSRFGAIDDPPAITDVLEGLHLKDSDHTTEEDPASRKKRSVAKGINRWPMFYIRIELQGRDNTASQEEDCLESNTTLQSVLDVLTAMLHQFLEQYHFRPRSGARAKRTRQSQSPAGREDRGGIKRPRAATRNSTTHITSFANIKSTSGIGDLLDSRVKLPSFSRSSPASPNPRANDFGSWSRIKSGRPGGYDDIWSGLPRGKSAPALDIDGKDKPNRDGTCCHSFSIDSISPTGITEESLPCQSNTGRHPKSDRPGENHRLSREDEGDGQIEESRDEVVHWTDPVTKKSVLINSRTGQTLRHGKPLQTSSRGADSSQQFASPGHHLCSNCPAPKPSLWIDSLLKEWKNPIFHQSEQPVSSAFEVPEMLLGGTSKSFLMGTKNTGFFPSSSRFSGRLTKKGLQEARFIAQVDKKFLLLRMPAPAGRDEGNQQILVLVDQHAADERRRIEQLFEELCGLSPTDSEPAPSGQVSTVPLSKPISFKVSRQEGELLQSHSDYFASWGCIYTLSAGPMDQRTVTVKRLPTLIAERCRLEPKLVIDLLRGEIWSRKDAGRRCPTSLPQFPSPDVAETNDSTETSKEISRTTATRHPWLERIGDCPKAIIDLLNSRACRSSIMFNDSLTREECKNLVSRLAVCAFPFHCAHGRPSVIPIVNLGSIYAPSEDGSAFETHSGPDSRFGNDSPSNDPSDNNGLSFLQAFKNWKPNDA